MNWAEMVVAIILIATIGKTIQIVLTARGHQADRADHPEILHARDEVRALKERIQVLERVITDNHGSNDLTSEIERLRDR